MFAAGSAPGQSVIVFTQLFLKAKERSSRPTGTKTEFNVKWPFKVTSFGISQKPTRDSILLHNNAGLIS